MKIAPDKNLRNKPYRSTIVFDETSLPAGFLAQHSTRAGVWGLLEIYGGELIYVIDAAEDTPEKRRVMHGGDAQIVESTLVHHVEIPDKADLRLHFFKERPDLDERDMI